MENNAAFYGDHDEVTHLESNDFANRLTDPIPQLTRELADVIARSNESWAYRILSLRQLADQIEAAEDLGPRLEADTWFMNFDDRRN